jgi:hypothetical protein
LAISWFHSKTDDDDDAVGEGEKKKLKMNSFCTKLFLLLAWVFVASLHGDHAVWVSSSA